LLWDLKFQIDRKNQKVPCSQRLQSYICYDPSYKIGPWEMTFWFRWLVHSIASNDFPAWLDLVVLDSSYRINKI